MMMENNKNANEMKDMQDELMKTLQENFSEEDLMELAEMMEEDMDKESADIKYSEPVIFAYEGDCTPNEEEYDKAITWYEIILTLPIINNCYKCSNICFLRFKPHLNLCYCYFKVGDINKAYYHHKSCMDINPNDPCVKYNETCFNLIIQKK